MHKERADKASLDLEIQKNQLQELQSKLIDTQSNKNSAHEDLLFKFDTQRRDNEEKHRDELSTMQQRINAKESDIYKMEQLLLQMNHSVDEAKSEKEQLKIQVEMTKVDKIRIEEKSVYLSQ